MSYRSPSNERYTVERKERSAGSTRKAAGSAKPASTAGASVRIETSRSHMNSRQKAVAEASMTKEERKAAKAKRREEDNLLYSATTVLTNKDERYKQLRRWWWALLIGAVVFTGLSWLTLVTNFGGQFFAVITLVLAYGGIIGALIMDFTVIRKRRNISRDRVAAMTHTQVERLVAEDYLQRDAESVGKQARKQARKAKKSPEECEEAYRAARDAVLNEAKAKKLASSASKEKGKGKAKAEAKEIKEDAAGSSEPTEEEKRLEAARKAARDFAASKR